MIPTMKREAVSGAVRQLASEGLVEPQQAPRVEARLLELLFPPSTGDAASKIAKLVAWLGGALVGAGVLTLVGLNWDALSKWTKLALIFGTLVGLHAAGWRLQVARDGGPGRAPGVGLALTGAAMLSFGGAIALVAQIYHLEAHWPNAVLAWWLLSLPFALLFASRWLLLIVVGLFSTWGMWCVDVWMTDHQLWSNEFGWGFAVVALAAFVAAAGALARGSRFGSFAPLLGLLGRLGALGGLFLLSFEEFGHDRVARFGQEGLLADERLHRFALLLAPAAVFAAGALALLAVGAAARRGWRDGRAWLDEPLDVAAVVAGAALAGCADLFVPDLAFLVVNALLLAAVLGLIVRGVRTGRVADVNLALVAFFVTAIARYFEFFSKGFDAAFTFLGAGVLLLGLGYFIERLRRKFVAQARRSRA
jgi:uncharacterized membrane protein